MKLNKNHKTSFMCPYRVTNYFSLLVIWYSNENAFATDEVDYADNNQSASYVPENLSSKDGGVASSTVAGYNEPKQETAPGGNQYSVAHSSPNYNFGFVPPIMGNQLTPIEGSEAQVRDVSRLPTFVVSSLFYMLNMFL